MDTSNLVATPVTYVSGATAITSAAVSKTAGLAESSSISPEAVQTVAKVIVTADTLAMASFVVMVLTFIWNVYISYRRDRREEKQRQWERQCRERELDILRRDGNKKPDDV